MGVLDLSVVNGCSPFLQLLFACKLVFPARLVYLSCTHIYIGTSLRRRSIRDLLNPSKNSVSVYLSKEEFYRCLLIYLVTASPVTSWARKNKRDCRSEPLASSPFLLIFNWTRVRIRVYVYLRIQRL